MPYSLHTLKNGLRVVLVPLKETKAVTALVLVKTGSRHEGAVNNGVSHFIEHMMFKGTVKRSKAIDISRELEGVGADFNAFTGKDMTGYYVKLAAEQLPLALDILADNLLNSKFSASEMEKERKVILEEINMYEDNPRANIDNIYEGLVYSGHALGRNISGPKVVIRNITRADLLKHKSSFYFAGNTVLALAGCFDKRKALPLISRHFHGFNRSKNEPPLRKFSSRQAKARIKIINKPTEQIHLALGFPAYADPDPRSIPARLLSVILGGGMSARLFVEAREKRGLCYSIFAGTSCYEDTGDFMVKAGLDTNRLAEVLKLIMKELKKIKHQGVGEAELKKAKEFIKGSTVLSLEDSEVQANWYGREVLYREAIMTPEQRLRQFQAVTADEIKAAAKELFLADRLNLALIGPLKQDSGRKIRRNLSL